MSKLLLVLMVGCGFFKEPVYPPVQVEIVKPIPKVENTIGFECMLEPRPKTPKEVAINYENEDAIARVWVHVRSYNEMVQYTKELDLWADTHSRCLRAIVRVLQ